MQAKRRRGRPARQGTPAVQQPAKLWSPPGHILLKKYKNQYELAYKNAVPAPGDVRGWVPGKLPLPSAGSSAVGQLCSWELSAAFVASYKVHADHPGRHRAFLQHIQQEVSILKYTHPQTTIAGAEVHSELRQLPHLCTEAACSVGFLAGWGSIAWRECSAGLEMYAERSVC